MNSLLPKHILFQAFMHDMDWWVMIVSFGCDVFFLANVSRNLNPKIEIFFIEFVI